MARKLQLQLLAALLWASLGCGTSADQAADVGVGDAGADSDSATTDSSPPAPKWLVLSPTDGTSSVSDLPLVQIYRVEGVVPAEITSRIHLMRPDRTAVAFDLEQKSVPPYVNVVVSPKGGLLGDYVLRVDPLPSGWTFKVDQPTKADLSAENAFTTSSRPHANRIAACGPKLFVEYSEKVMPASPGDISIEYATDPKPTGCSLSTPGAAPLALFSFSCSTIDASRTLHVVAKSLRGTGSVDAPAVTADVVLLDAGECAFGYIR